MTELAEVLAVEPQSAIGTRPLIYVKIRKIGESIVKWPEIMNLHMEEDHGEDDTVVGKKVGKETLIFSWLEK